MHLQFEAILTASRESSSPYDFALVAMLGLLGLRIFEATGADIADLSEEHGHRVLRVCGKGTKVVLVPLPSAVARSEMIVDSLWRFRKSPLIQPALAALITDPDVTLHAMSAMRRSIGPVAALPYLRQVAADHPGNRLAKAAASQIRRAEASVSRQQPTS